MRIMILSINYWPEETGIGAFTTYRAEYLAAAGHDVTVCTTFPYYPEWKVPQRYSGRLTQTETRNGVRIVRGYAYIPNPVTTAKRILHEATFILGCTLRALTQKRPDVLFVISPPLGLGPAAIFLSRLWRIPYVFDVEDLQPDAAAELKMLPGWALNFLYRVERSAYKYAALVSTLTHGMRDRIVSRGVPAQKVELFEPRADESLLDLGQDEADAFRRKYGLEGKFLVTHSGNMGLKQALGVIVEAAAMNHKDDSTVFLLVGDGADRENIQNRIADLGLSNVRLLPLLETSEFRGLLGASDLCLVTQQKSVSDIVFPSKVVTYLTAGRPVLGSVNSKSEVARVICESGAGRVVEPENAEVLLRAIHELRETDLEACSLSAREYACRRWSSARVLGHLEKMLLEIGTSAPGPLAPEGAGQ